jgi:hypothetical protein
MASTAQLLVIARDDSRDDDDTLYSGVRLRRHFGGVSHMWLRRRLQTDANFPRPVYIGSIPFYRLGDVRRWEAGLPTAPPPMQVALGKQGVEVLKEARRKRKSEAPPPVRPVRRRRRPAKALEPE